MIATYFGKKVARYVRRFGRMMSLKIACAGFSFLLTLAVIPSQAEQRQEEEIRRVSLRECVESALINNRALQIERINPEIARMALKASYGYYDPTLTSQFDRETATDTGGFDPADFSADAVYSAESEVGNLGIVGFLPSGMSYTIGGTYAHSSGARNFMEFDSYKLGTAISIRQPLLKNFWTDAGRTTIRINKHNLKITELGVKYLAMDVMRQVQVAYYELCYSYDNLKVHDRLLETKENTAHAVRRQVEAGILTALEERIAVSQAAKIKADLIWVSNSVVTAENMLKTLMGYTETNWLSGRMVPTDHLLVVREPLDMQDSWRHGYAQRPDLAQMRENLERANTNLKYRKNQLFPSLDLVAGYGRRGASAVQMFPPGAAKASLSSALDQIDNADAPNDMIGVIFSIPLTRTSERANYKASKELKQQAGLVLKQKEELILREVSDAYHNAQSASERVSATQKARDYAQLALEAEEHKLIGGKSSLFFVLQLQSDLADAETAVIRAKADYNQAMAQLRFAEGSLLDRCGIVFDIR